MTPGLMGNSCYNLLRILATALFVDALKDIENHLTNDNVLTRLTISDAISRLESCRAF